MSMRLGTTREQDMCACLAKTFAVGNHEPLSLIVPHLYFDLSAAGTQVVICHFH